MHRAADYQVTRESRKFIEGSGYDLTQVTSNRAAVRRFDRRVHYVVSLHTEWVTLSDCRTQQRWYSKPSAPGTTMASTSWRLPVFPAVPFIPLFDALNNKN